MHQCFLSMSSKWRIVFKMTLKIHLFLTIPKAQTISKSAKTKLKYIFQGGVNLKVLTGMRQTNEPEFMLNQFASTIMFYLNLKDFILKIYLTLTIHVFSESCLTLTN